MLKLPNRTRFNLLQVAVAKGALGKTFSSPWLNRINQNRHQDGLNLIGKRGNQTEPKPLWGNPGHHWPMFFVSLEDLRHNFIQKSPKQNMEDLAWTMKNQTLDTV